MTDVVVREQFIDQVDADALVDELRDRGYDAARESDYTGSKRVAENIGGPTWMLILLWVSDKTAGVLFEDEVQRLKSWVRARWAGRRDQKAPSHIQLIFGPDGEVLATVEVEDAIETDLTA